MFGPIPELGCQIPQLGRSDEIQNYLHGGANAHVPFGVVDTIVCPELVASRQSARAVMCVKTLANYIEVTDTLMTVSESYRLCGHKSKPLVVSGVPAACPVACTHDRNSRRSFRYADLQDIPRTLQSLNEVQSRADAT